MYAVLHQNGMYHVLIDICSVHSIESRLFPAAFSLLVLSEAVVSSLVAAPGHAITNF